MYNVVFVLFSALAGDKEKVVDILAKYCDEKSKLQQLKDKYKEKHSQVSILIISNNYLINSKWISFPCLFPFSMILLIYASALLIQNLLL